MPSTTKSSVSTSRCSSEPDLLGAWEDLLGWSENAAAARKMQEEMIIVKYALNRLGNKSILEQLDTEPAIQIAIAAFKSEKSQLQTYRTNMLRLNATVHSWLTRQERKLQASLTEQQLLEASAKVKSEQPKKQACKDGEDERNHIEGPQSEHKIKESQQRQQLQIHKSSTSVCVTDRNGHSMVNQVIMTDAVTTTTTMASTAECDSTVVSVGSVDKAWDLNTLMNSEKEFHKHLKDEVSDMYSAWDEADARINAQLEMLTTSQIAWRQLESGLSEFQLALGQDRGTLKGLEGALNKGQATPIEMAQNVKLVAKLLSEKVSVSQEQLTAVQEHLDPNHILYIAKLTASNGSLSDSGISDGGTTSDGGLSERERRLGVLRRLAKQLESALAPGSDTMKSIAARMESAEAELKNLQNTCRDLIVRTAATHQNKKQQLQLQFVTKQRADSKSNANENPNAFYHAGEKNTAADQNDQQPQSYSDNFQSTETSTKRKNKRKQRENSRSSCVNDMGGSRTGGGRDNGTDIVESAALCKFPFKFVAPHALANADGGNSDPLDDPSDECELDTSDDSESKAPRGWAWRIAKAAVPMQLALFTFLVAACLMQPDCCDNLNNLSMGFTPQLRYIRGPPPI